MRERDNNRDALILINLPDILLYFHQRVWFLPAIHLK